MLEGCGYLMKVAESDDSHKVAVVYKSDLAEYVMTETLSNCKTSLLCHFILTKSNKHFVFINGFNEAEDTEGLKYNVPK